MYSYQDTLIYSHKTATTARTTVLQ